MRYLWHSTFWIKTERRGTEKRRKQRTKMDKENEKGEVQAAKEKQRVCKRCKETYSASSNTPTSCRYHPSFFVCRRHDDQIRYYELGPEDPPYAAKFYDCCGAEDAESPGCTSSFHISYDDE